MKIFIVEDDEFVSRMYERAFRMRGHEVLIANDGVEAAGTLSAMEVPPAAILLDVVMPKRSGTDVLKDIRANARFDAVPIAILTNSIHPEKAVEFISLGADLYLVKLDNQAKDVVGKIEELINKGRTPVKRV